MKRHDKRAETGQYRERTEMEQSIAQRESMARSMTQTHSGPATHSREPRREAFNVVCYDAPRFKDRKVNRDGYNPFGRDSY